MFEKLVNTKTKTENKGFTLVELIITIAIIAIVIGAAAWGVTGWIEHYEYVASEEKAKTIYLAAQSALSAKESRGTLDDYVVSLRKAMGGDGNAADSKIFYNVEQPAEDADAEEKLKYKGENPNLKKNQYNIPSATDNEGNEHEYGYLSVNLGIYSDDTVAKNDGQKALFDLIEDYITEKEILNGSILMEIDLTAGKVYSVFYSGWATSIDYLPNSLSNDKTHSKVRETYYVYYSNESNDARRPEEREDYAVGYYAVDQVNVITLDDLGKAVNVNECQLHNEETLYLSLNSADSDLNDIDIDFEVNLYKKDDNSKLCSFTVSKHKEGSADLTNGNVRKDELDVELASGSIVKMPFIVYCKQSETDASRDVLCVVLDAAMTSQSTAVLTETAPGDRTDPIGYSITRLMGVDPCDIYAGATALGNEKADATYIPGDEIPSNTVNALFAAKAEDGTLEIARIRHLSNIRYTERIAGATDTGNTYKLTADLDYSKAEIYDRVTDSQVCVSTNKVGFPMIDRLTEKSVLAGGGKKISNLLLNNTSGISYERKNDGSVDTTVALANTQNVVGLFGKNFGTVQNLTLNKAKLEVLPKSVENADGSVYGDKVEAAGIICARSFGTLRNITFDKNCSAKADVFMKMDDKDEAAADGLDITDAGVLATLNEKYGCGVGMLTGTLVVSGNAVNKVTTAGTVEGILHDAEDVPATTDDAARANIYSTTIKDAEGYTNADRYSYGVGGVVGYAFEEYNASITTSGIGRTLASTEPSVVNRAFVKGAAFTGGIVGNLYVTGVSYTGNVDGDNDSCIPAHAGSQIINCRNYGDTTGIDFVGGIVGVNGTQAYIKSCISYGSPSASNGVSAGITSENFGFIEDCYVERAEKDSYSVSDYVPEIDGNMQYAGAIASVNHRGCVIKECKAAVNTIEGVAGKIRITGNDMETFGYLVGRNDGVVDGGQVGQFVDYDSQKTKMTIGGAVGSNFDVVKNLTVTAKLADEGEAQVIGGVVGENLGGRIRKCIFGGKIDKKKGNTVDVIVGGIAGKNSKATTSTVGSTISGCYVVGAVLDVTGRCTYTETDSETNRIKKSSAVGGVCAVNDNGCTIENCYLTGVCESGATDNDAYTKIARQTTITVPYGMVGGVAAINYGFVKHCGYTDKIFCQNGDEINKISAAGTKDMALLDTADTRLETIKSKYDAGSKDYNDIENKVKALSDLFMYDNTGKLKEEAARLCGTLKDNKESYQYALPKEACEETYNGIRYSWDAYTDETNYVVMSMSNGRGCIGGIVGYNTKDGSVTKCASGRWLVENYLPAVKYNATGGVVGLNAASGEKVNTDINFAYVRNELPRIPVAYLDESGRESEGYVKNVVKRNNRFYYVGGVIGEQRNEVNNGAWDLSMCVNVGTVLNYYGNNVGGVAGKIAKNGGTIDCCYNYGMLMSGYTTGYMNGFSGTAGGIVSQYCDLVSGQTNNVLHCRNYGTVGFAAQGVNYNTNAKEYALGAMMSNDSGGIIGEISAPQSSRLYTVNIIDCVNDKNARVYAYSQNSGILGMVGCLISETINGSNSFTVDSIFVNIDTCRNYSSQIWDANGIKTAGPETFLNKRGGGIYSGRSKYKNADTAIGYTTINNCFSIIMMGFDNGGTAKKTGNDGGKVVSVKHGNNNNLIASTKYSRNNFYMDEYSFQYDGTRKLHSDGSVTNAANGLASDSGNITRFISGSVINNNSIVANGGSSKTITDTRSVMDKHVNVSRIAVLTYGASGSDYVLISEPTGYTKNLTTSNAWLDGDKVCFKTAADTTMECPVIYSFSEGTSASTFSISSVDHFNFDRNRTGNTTRLPFADEYDMDLREFDVAFLKYIDKCKNSQTPDKIKTLNVDKNSNEGNYLAKWTVENDATATKFDVEISYYKCDPGTAFSLDSLGSYTSVHDTETFVSYGTTMGFTSPSDLVMENGYDYYAVVKVGDTRAASIPDSSDYYKKAFKKLQRKLPTPEFEIISYKSKWMLHLKNGNLFKDYAGLTGFELGVYGIKANDEEDTNRKITMHASDMCASSGGSKIDAMLNDVVDAKKLATGEADQVLYGYAKADGCLDADLYKFTVYIPKASAPDIEYELEEKENGLDKKKKPYYTGTLNYTKFDNNTTESPSMAQIFRVELYGVKKETDDQGKETVWHETLARKDYALTQGNSAEVNIGYYDAQSNIKFTDYESFGIDTTYYSPGQGDVYNCVDVDKTYAEKKLRRTGFITDLSEGTAQYRFYYSPLKTPKIKVICLDRTPSWYVVLENPSDYFDRAALIKYNISKNGGTYYTIDPNGEPQVVNGLTLYAGKVDQTNWTVSGTKILYKLIDLTEENPDSVAAKYYGSNNDMKLQINLEANIKVSYSSLACTFTKDATMKIVGLTGSFDYTSHDGNPYITQYFRYELYGKDGSGNTVTVYLSDDIAMGKTSGTYTINADLSGIDMTKYTDLKVAVWYSKSNLRNDSDLSAYLYQYLELSESDAKKMDCYDRTTDTFTDARNKGLLIYDSPTGTKYYYVSALFDNDSYSCKNDTYGGFCLYREADVTE